MEQFTVRPLFGGTELHWYTITNQTVWMAAVVAVVIVLFALGTRRRALVPSRTQSIGELAFGFIRNMIVDIGGKDMLVFFPHILTLFLVIVTANLLSLIPYSFSIMAQFAVTVTLAVAVFVTVTVMGFVKHGVGFLKLFWVSSAPAALRPVLAIIELMSYFVRPVSHSIRLAGNMMAGHAVFAVFAGFAVVAVISPVSVLAISAMYALETIVAIVQAYVFTILAVVYLNDAYHPGH
ncbi:MAG: F0F1 ATP synthase subunit A [Alphaproteobacteria bacterium]|nr:MAG: F0F1 ATP synthase subunit A [Alphaproteobacteria bacterium]